MFFTLIYENIQVRISLCWYLLILLICWKLFFVLLNTEGWKRMLQPAPHHPQIKAQTASLTHTPPSHKHIAVRKTTRTDEHPSLPGCFQLSRSSRAVKQRSRGKTNTFHCVTHTWAQSACLCAQIYVAWSTSHSADCEGIWPAHGGCQLMFWWLCHVLIYMD